MEIEAWDASAWKQLLSSLESLKAAWEGRAKELEERATQFSMQLQYGSMGYHPAQVQQEGARLQGVCTFALFLAARLTDRYPM